jgi:hypothetical protein
MTTETKPVAEKPPRTRTVAPGRHRLMVSVTDALYDKLISQAKRESEVFPRPANEQLSILIEKYESQLFEE